MLADGKIESLDTHLEQFKLSNQTAQHELENLLQEYGQLLEDYKLLKKAHELKSAKSLSSKVSAKSTKSGQPYVLVLIDGNGYIFNDELISDKEEGGMRAARMLNEGIEKYLRQSFPEALESRVIVRIYADLTNLSKQLGRSKLVGLEKRSISSFTAGFTRVFSSFDFVDTLDEEGTKFKIREQFKAASEDSACSHILYAACHDNAYLSDMMPLSGARNKITLVQAAGWLSDFHQFGFKLTQFPTVFRWSDLPNPTPIVKLPNAPASIKAQPAQNRANPSVAAIPEKRELWSSSSRSSVADSNITGSMTGNGFDKGNGYAFGKKPANSHKSTKEPGPCRFFQKGFCRLGTDCTFQHVPNSLNGSASPAPKAASSIRTGITSKLPSTASPGYIPLNKDLQRLDAFIRPPTQSEWVMYNQRFNKRKPCNAYQLQRSCMSNNCPFDHSELEPEVRHVLEYVVKCTPCPKKSDCRAIDCHYGHLCQKDGCTGKSKGCRMKADLHSIDPKMTSVVAADLGEKDEEDVFQSSYERSYEKSYEKPYEKPYEPAYEQAYEQDYMRGTGVEAPPKEDGFYW